MLQVGFVLPIFTCIIHRWGSLVSLDSMERHLWGIVYESCFSCLLQDKGNPILGALIATESFYDDQCLGHGKQFIK